MHLRQLEYTHSTRYIYQNEPDKACFQQNMASGGFKDLPRRNTSDKIFCNKGFNDAENSEYDGYHRGMASLINRFIDKKSSSEALSQANNSVIISEIMLNQ